MDHISEDLLDLLLELGTRTTRRNRKAKQAQLSTKRIGGSLTINGPRMQIKPTNYRPLKFFFISFICLTKAVPNPILSKRKFLRVTPSFPCHFPFVKNHHNNQPVHFAPFSAQLPPKDQSFSITPLLSTSFLLQFLSLNLPISLLDSNPKSWLRPRQLAPTLAALRTVSTHRREPTKTAVDPRASLRMIETMTFPSIVERLAQATTKSISKSTEKEYQ